MSGRYAHLLDAIELAEPGYVLEFFAEHAKRAAQGERLPVFELFLNSGQTLKGTPIKVMQLKRLKARDITSIPTIRSKS